MVYPAVCDKCGEVEINKPMAADFPLRHTCGGKLTRRFTVPAVTYAADGFYSTDVSRMQKLVGADRYAKFEAQRDEAQKRAKRGALTPYERQLENV